MKLVCLTTIFFTIFILDFNTSVGKKLDYFYYWVEVTGAKVPYETVIGGRLKNILIYIVQVYSESAGWLPGYIYSNDTNRAFVHNKSKLEIFDYPKRVLCSHRHKNMKWMGVKTKNMHNVKCPNVTTGRYFNSTYSAPYYIIRAYLNKRPMIVGMPGNCNCYFITLEDESKTKRYVDAVDLLTYNCGPGEVKPKDNKEAAANEPKFDVFEFFWVNWTPGTVPTCAVTIKADDIRDKDYHIGTVYVNVTYGLVAVTFADGDEKATGFVTPDEKFQRGDGVQVLCSKLKTILEFRVATKNNMQDVDCPVAKIGKYKGNLLYFTMVVKGNPKSPNAGIEFDFRDAEEKANITYFPLPSSSFYILVDCSKKGQNSF